MDLRSLNYFCAVAEELNFTRAAQRLSISQPPLSNQMKALEEELGTPLFVRGSRGVSLTEAGKLLYRRASQSMKSSGGRWSWGLLRRPTTMSIWKELW